MKIVRFKDGRFGIRRKEGFFSGYKFKDLTNSKFWWCLDSEYFPDCRGTFEKAKTMFDTVTNNNDIGEVVKEITNELCYHTEENV